MSTADQAAIASAAAAAVAAVASWASVAQASRLQRRSIEPRLHIQVSIELDAAPGKRVKVRVENSGGGFAQEALFYVREGSRACVGGLPPHGSLGAGQGVTLVTGLEPVGDKVEALVTWKYGAKVYAQAGAPAHRKSWSRRKWAFWAPKTSAEIAHRFFPDAPPLDQLTPVAYKLESAS